MKTYCLHENTDDGSIDLIETRPVVLATFQSRDLADRVLAMLTQAAADASAATSATEMAEPVNHMTTETIQAEVCAKMTSGVTSDTASGREMDDKPTPKDWAAAFQAIKGGANMDDVAQTLGVTFFHLRGKYANWSRSQKAVKGAKGADINTESCRMCGKEFTSSAVSDGLCARCRA